MTLSSSSASFDTGKRHFLALCSPRGIKNRNYLGVVQCVDFRIKHIDIYIEVYSAQKNKNMIKFELIWR